MPGRGKPIKRKHRRCCLECAWKFKREFLIEDFAFLCGDIKTLKRIHITSFTSAIADIDWGALGTA